MKKVLILMILLVQAILYHSCNNNSDTKAEKSTVLANQSDVDEGAMKFMKLASESGIMEVQFSMVARQKSRSPAVKEFAEMMIADHTRIYNDLKKLASDKHILLPIEMDKSQTDQLNTLTELSGAKFDQNYMRMMAASHQKAIELYKEGANNRDKDVNQFAQKKITLLEDHLNSARSIFNNVVLNRQ
jgi:putative membrane protein